MRVAVTGAAGYLGVNLLHHLVGDGHQVTAIDRRSSALAPAENVRWAVADVLDGAEMRSALAGAEIVYHLAAKITLKQHDPDAWRINTEGVATVAEAALGVGVRRLVHCSTVHTFDETRSGPVLTERSVRSDRADMPVYARSKYAGERALLALLDRGLDAVICNPTGVYGPIDDPDRLSRMNSMVLDGALGRAPASVAGGFDFVDVRDVAQGLVLAAESGRTGENYLLPGEMVTIHHLLAKAAKATGRRGPLVAVPLSVVEAILPLAQPISEAFGSDVLSAGSVQALLTAVRVDGSKARDELGYRPRPFAQTVRDMVAYLVQAGVLERRGRPAVRPAAGMPR